MVMLCFETNIIFAPAKKQPWASSLCHSLVPHTNVDLSLRYEVSAIGLLPQVKPTGAGLRLISVGFIILDGFQSTQSSNKEDTGRSPAPAGRMWMVTVKPNG